MAIAQTLMGLILAFSWISLGWVAIGPKANARLLKRQVCFLALATPLALAGVWGMYHIMIRYVG